MVLSSGVTPAAVIRTSTLPSARRGLGTSTSFSPPYPVNDSARIALIEGPPSPGFGKRAHPGFFNDLGAVVAPSSLMSGDYSAWVERLDWVERRDPRAAGVRS